MVFHEGDEVESTLLQQSNQQHNNEEEEEDDNNKNLNLFSSLGRQNSIYSLTLDEFQHALCENGKNFGSMNMDEFLNSIWSAEENQGINNNNNNLPLRKQPSLPRQGSLTIPAPLCRKTVDEVWSEIQKGQQSQQQQQQQQQQNQKNNNSNNKSGVSEDNGSGVKNTESVPRQPTFGEMTLEDFLVKAGVVREPGAMHVQQPHQQNQNQHHQYGMYSNNNSILGPSFVGRPPVIGIGGGGNVVAPPYQAMAHGGGAGAIGEPSGYVGNGKRNTGYPPLAAAPGVCFGGRVVNGGGVYGATAPPMGMAVAPVSPVSSDGIGTSENSGGQFGMDMGLVRGRKRVLDGPVEKVVERRQRRMIKNRESAARSRARKQAYTVELEAELNQLREENSQLKQALAELERRRKQQSFEEMNVRVQTKAQKAMKKFRSLRRNLSCSL